MSQLWLESKLSPTLARVSRAYKSPMTIEPHPPSSHPQAPRAMVSQDKAKNVGEMAGEERFSREMAAARGLHGDPA